MKCWNRLAKRSFSVLALSAFTLPAVADGYQMKDGRYASGPVTVIDLTPDQVLSTKTKRVVVLSSSQKALLLKEAGVAPSVLSIHSLNVAGKDCTCGEYNLAIWFSPEKIEVPHRYLVDDAEAEKAAENVETMWDE